MWKNAFVLSIITIVVAELISVSPTMRIALLIVLYSGLTITAYAQHADVEHRHVKSEYESARSKLLSKIKDRWADQIERSTNLQDDTEVDLTGPNEKVAIHGGYVVTSHHNPLISKECHADSLAAGVLHWKREGHFTEDEAFGVAERHIHNQQEELSKGVTFTEWIKHIAECKVFCNIAVLQLLACHVQAVAEHEHDIVLFHTGSHHLDSDSRSDRIADFVARMRQDEQKKVLLIGRASQLGSKGPKFNRELSQKRAHTVRDQLVDMLIPQDRIVTQYIGYEEPQITQGIAEIYGFKDIYQKAGEFGINQSVLMVLY